MKNRIKWLLVGLGITFGLQVLISLIFTGIAFSAARSESGTQEESISVLILGFTIGSFLVGGFVIGWLEESIRVTDGLIVAVATLILSALIYISLPHGNKGQFVTGIYLGGGADQFLLTGRGAIFAALALVAAAAGSYLGGRVSAPQESALDRVAVLLGLIGAIVGPFVLLAVGGNESASNQPNLPWYFLVIVLVVLLLIVAAGFVMFTRESHYEEEISISPDRRLEH